MDVQSMIREDLYSEITLIFISLFLVILHSISGLTFISGPEPHRGGSTRR